jgi:photosystem II stability/assembly factor-like uncharacterized protein
MKNFLLPGKRVLFSKVLFLLSVFFLFIARFASAQEDSLPPAKLPFWDKIKGPASNDIRALLVDDNTGRIYGGTSGNGVIVSSDSGKTWTSASSGLTNMYITCLDFNGGTLYAGTWGGGVFRSDNQGGLWTAVNQGLNARFIRSIKSDSGMVYAGTYGQGVFRSSDKGGTWQAANSHLWHMDVTALIFNLQGDLLAGTAGGGIFKSSDQGLSWNSSNGDLSNKYVTSFVMNSVGDMYAGTYGGGVNFSMNGGATWTLYKEASPDIVTCVTYYTDDQPVAGTNAIGLFKYDNLWEQWRQSNMKVYGTYAIARTRSGVLYASLPKEGFCISYDGGMFWQRISNRGEKGLSILISFKNGIMAGTTSKGQLYISKDNGTSWSR